MGKYVMLENDVSMMCRNVQEFESIWRGRIPMNTSASEVFFIGGDGIVNAR